MALVIKNCTVALTNIDGVVIIPAGTVPNACMQFRSGPTGSPDYSQDGTMDGRPMYSVRVNNPAGLTWPTPGDVLTVSAFPAEPRLVGSWEIDRLETGGFSTLLLFVKSIVQTEPLP